MAKEVSNLALSDFSPAIAPYCWINSVSNPRLQCDRHGGAIVGWETLSSFQEKELRRRVSVRVRTCDTRDQPVLQNMPTFYLTQEELCRIRFSVALYQCVLRQTQCNTVTVSMSQSSNKAITASEPPLMCLNISLFLDASPHNKVQLCSF